MDSKGLKGHLMARHGSEGLGEVSPLQDSLEGTRSDGRSAFGRPYLDSDEDAGDGNAVIEYPDREYECEFCRDDIPLDDRILMRGNYTFPTFGSLILHDHRSHGDPF